MVVLDWHFQQLCELSPESIKQRNKKPGGKGELHWWEAAGVKMELMYVWLLFLLFRFASSYHFKSGAGNGLFVQDPALEWEEMETVIGEKMSRGPLPVSKLLRSASSGGSSTPEPIRVLEYVTVSKSQDQKEVFEPEKGARPLPASVKEMLLGATATPSIKPPARKKIVEILCHVDRMYVRIRREVFRTRDAYKYLKLGSCPVNQGTKEHYYLLYLLETDCGFTVKVGEGVFLSFLQ